MKKNEIMLILTTLAISKATQTGTFQNQMIKQELGSTKDKSQIRTVEPIPRQATQLTDPPLPTFHDVHNTAAASDVDIKAEKSPPRKKSALDDLLGDVFIQKVEVLPQKAPLEKVNIEIIQYQKEKSLSLTGNPLEWWKEHQMFYPYLSNLAKQYLGIPATSVPSERVFSTTGDIITAQRAALKPAYVDMMVFLKKTKPLKLLNCHKRMKRIAENVELCSVFLLLCSICTKLNHQWISNYHNSNCLYHNF